MDIIYYCENCGWNITGQLLKRISGLNDPISFCQNCGLGLSSIETSEMNDNYEHGNLYDNYKKDQYSEEWIEVLDKSIFHNLYKKIRQSNKFYTYERLAKEIGITKKSFDGIINQGNRIRKVNFENFKKLAKKILGQDIFVNLFGVDDIPHKVIIGVGGHDKITLPENDLCAEFMGIMLGDGRISKNGKTVRIALNGVDEEAYVDYIENKILKRLFKNISFNIYYDIGFSLKSKGIWFECRIKSVHSAILEKGIRNRDDKNGLIAGNKVINQVGVPDWIMRDNTIKYILIRKCIKGLFDTDGSISIVNKGRIRLEFYNESLTCVKDFHEMCSKLKIECLLNSLRKKCYILRRDQVVKFLDLISPQKFKEPYRRLWLGLNIFYYNFPDYLKSDIKNEIIKFKKQNHKSRFDYSKSNSLIMKEICEDYLIKYNMDKVYGFEFNGFVTEEMIELAIDSSLYYDNVVYKYNNEELKYRIIKFPKELKEEIYSLIVQIINENYFIDNDKLIEILNNFIESSGFQGIVNPFHDFDYQISLNHYFDAIIQIAKEVKKRLSQKEDDFSRYSIYKSLKNNEEKIQFSKHTIYKIMNIFLRKFT